MVYGETTFLLKDGRAALLRTPREEDAKALLAFIVRASGETEFLMRYPEEYSDYTDETERAFIRRAVNDPDALMIACLVDGKFAANCQLLFSSKMKNRHRASVAISVLKEYWGLGIGTKLLEEMLRMAGERPGVRQVELEFIEGNSRARSLYEKMGFRITGLRPDAIRLKDGTFVNEYMMVKRLDR